MDVAVETNSNSSWVRCTVPPNCDRFHKAALELADRTLKNRCGAATAVYESWRRVADGGQPLDDIEKRLLATFVRPGFGIPEKPLVPDHVQGMTAEYLWYFSTIDWSQDDEDTILAIQPPGLSPSSSGGDGLVVHQGSRGSCRFFLWELKKNTGNAHVSSTVRTAYKQLRDNAPEYLAKYVAPGGLSAGDNPEVAALLSVIVDEWLAGSERAGAGIAVATSFPKTPQKCFSTFSDYFPQLQPRLKGAVFGVGDFVAFSNTVRDALWIGL